MRSLSAAPAQPRLSTSPNCTRSNSPRRDLPPHSHPFSSLCPIRKPPEGFLHCKVTEGFILKLLQPQRCISCHASAEHDEKHRQAAKPPSLLGFPPKTQPCRQRCLLHQDVHSGHHPAASHGGGGGVPPAWRSAQENMSYLLPGPACPWATPGMPKTSPRAPRAAMVASASSRVSPDTSGARWQLAFFFLYFIFFLL